jgi:hypothetical protein
MTNNLNLTLTTVLSVCHVIGREETQHSASNNKLLISENTN